MNLFKLLAVYFVPVSIICAEPTIVYDSGDTISASKYLSQFQPANNTVPDFGKSWVMQLQEPVKPPLKTKKTPFPITTSLMSAKRVDGFKDNFMASLPNPICLIGSDDLSKQWILFIRDHLLDIGAHCWIVQANNESELNEISTLLNGVKVFPANGDDIAKYFNIDYYPVLINQRVVSQ